MEGVLGGAVMLPQATAVMDPGLAQLQRRQTAELSCPKAMVRPGPQAPALSVPALTHAALSPQVGRVIGKNGETIKALQAYTGALIQIDQVRRSGVTSP